MDRFQLTPDAIPLLLELATPIERDEAIARVAKDRGIPVARLREIFDALVNCDVVTGSSHTRQTSALSFGFGRLTDHRAMLADHARVIAFRDALDAVVREGDTVVDVGSGSGILSFFAARAGAKAIYGLESERIIDDARQLARDNGLDDRVTFVEGDAASFASPTPADVVVGEWIGMCVFDEWRHFEAFARVRDACLRPGGAVVPSRLHVFMVPVEDSRLYVEAGPGFWQRPLLGLDVRLGHRRFVEQPRLAVARVSRSSFLGDPREILDLDCSTAHAGSYFFETSWKMPCTRDAMCHGYSGWFVLDLAPGIGLDTSPFSPQTTWHQMYFPLEAFFIRAGDELATHVKTEPSEGTGAPALTLSLELRRGAEIVHRAAVTYPVGDPRPF